MTHPPFAESLEFTDDDLLLWASDRIRSYCGWHIAPSVTETLTLDGSGGKLLLLPSLRVTDIAAVTASGTALTDTTDYTWSELGMLSRSGCYAWPSGFRSVTVTLTHGWDGAPEELTEVCISAAKRRPAQMASVDSEAAGGLSRTYGAKLSGGFASTGWTLAEQQVLDRYKIGTRP